jgi:hypothetical protein
VCGPDRHSSSIAHEFKIPPARAPRQPSGIARSAGRYGDDSDSLTGFVHELCSESHERLVVLDVGIPDLDGIEAALQIQHTSPSYPQERCALKKRILLSRQHQSEPLPLKCAGHQILFSSWKVQPVCFFPPASDRALHLRQHVDCFTLVQAIVLRRLHGD